MSVTETLVASTFDEVEIGPLIYRIQRVTTHDLVAAGGKILLAAAGASSARQAEPTPQQLVQGVEFAVSLVCAGVVGASEDGGKTWEPLQFVPSQEDESLKDGRVWIARLVSDHVKILTVAVRNLASDGGAADQRIARFLGGKSGAARCAGGPVRDGS